MRRLRAAIGPTAIPVDVQLASVLRMLEGQLFCRGCGNLYAPLAHWCKCGAPTFSPYAEPDCRAARVPRAPESLQIATLA